MNRSILILLASAALLAGCDDPPPMPQVRQAEAIAWGPAENGLQAGIACPSQVQLGEALAATIYLRNVSDGSIALLRYQGGPDDPPWAVAPDGQQIWASQPPWDGPVMQVTTTLQAGAQMELRVNHVRLRPLGGYQPLWAENFVKIAPGPYRFGTAYGFQLGDKHVQLKTGTIPVNVTPRP